VAHLLLARAAARERETAVRRALGAGDRHLLRQSFAESAVLAALAAAAALALALGGLAAVRALAPADLPRLAGAGLDARTFLAALALAAAVAVVFALVPAVLARRRSLVWGLRGQASGAAPGGSRSLLVVVEVALAVALTVAAGILVRGFWDLWHVDPGFATRGVLKAQVQLPTTRYPKDYAVWPQWDGIHRLRRGLLERLESLPGVESAAVASAHPLDRGFTNSLVVVGREMQAGTWPEASMRLVSPGYFATLGVALREGRLLGTGDLTDGPRVAVVNESAVRRYFPGGGAVGSSLRLWGNAWRVVGVVADERIHGLAEAPPPAVYLSLEQAPAHDVAVLVRTAGEPLGLAAAVRAAIHEQDPALAVFGVEPLASTLTGSLAEQRFLLVLLGVFAAVALALAAIGVYGLLAYRVALRTPELGLRSALGAGRRELLGLVMGEGARLAGAGLLVGSLGALAARRVVVSLVAGSGAGGPGTWLAVVGVVGAAVVAATLLPARRAAAVDPMRALRAE
jgi:predicted permease